MSSIETAGFARNARGFFIAPMTEHDLLEVVEIEESCGLSRWGWDAYHAELGQGEQAVMLVARARESQEQARGERIVGFIASRLVADELHINNVAVRPQFRRAGVGKELLSSALKRGAAQGARAAFLEVRASNIPAQTLYSSCGFRLTGRRPGYYTEPAEDALVMSLAMRSSA